MLRFLGVWEPGIGRGAWFQWQPTGCLFEVPRQGLHARPSTRTFLSRTLSGEPMLQGPAKLFRPVLLDLPFGFANLSPSCICRGFSQAALFSHRLHLRSIRIHILSSSRILTIYDLASFWNRCISPVRICTLPPMKTQHPPHLEIAIDARR